MHFNVRPEALLLTKTDGTFLGAKSCCFKVQCFTRFPCRCHLSLAMQRLKVTVF